ncbi:MAG: type I restriction endonuclease [Patescibacteria group bacterium]
MTPELNADFGIKKGEKVDYAILKDGKPLILIECKHFTQKLDIHSTQLYRYFSVTDAKFAILTNGIEYQFYTDLDDKNKMDQSPFLTINLLNMRPNHIEELKKFHKENFDSEKISSTATSLKYITRYKKLLSDEFAEPSDEFIKLFAKRIFEGKVLTSHYLEFFKDIIKRGSGQFLNEILNEKLSSALKTNTAELKTEENSQNVDEADEAKDQIVTTQLELEAYYIIKSIAREVVESNRITYKDTLSYFGVMLDGKVTKWFCRNYLSGKKFTIGIADANKVEHKFELHSIEDIYQHKGLILAGVQGYLK